MAINIKVENAAQKLIKYLKQMGADIYQSESTIVIDGGKKMHGTEFTKKQSGRYSRQMENAVSAEICPAFYHRLCSFFITTILEIIPSLSLISGIIYNLPPNPLK